MIKQKSLNSNLNVKSKQFQSIDLHKKTYKLNTNWMVRIYVYWKENAFPKIGKTE